MGEVLGDRNIGDSAAGSVAASPIVVLLSLCRDTTDTWGVTQRVRSAALGRPMHERMFRVARSAPPGPSPPPGRGNRNGSLPRRGRRSKARPRGLRRLLSRLPPPLVGGLLDPMRGAQVPSQRKGVREPPVTFRTLQPLDASCAVRRRAREVYPWQRDQTIADGREHTTEVLHQSPLCLRHQLSLVLEPQLFPSEPLHREQQGVSHSGCLVPPGSGMTAPIVHHSPLAHYSTGGRGSLRRRDCT